MLWYRKKRRRKSASLNTISLIVASDTHLHYEAFDDPEFPNLSSPPMYFYTGRAKLEFLTNYINNNIPDAVVLTGDIVHSGGDNLGYDTFMSYWNTIDESVLKLLSTGNHDYSRLRQENELELPVHEYVATKLGYIGYDMNARSYFNQSFELNKDGVKVKFIHVETNINEEGEYDSQTPGYIHSDTRGWVSQEIDNFDGNIVVLYSHKGDSYLDADDMATFNIMLDSKIAINPNLKIIWIYGHKHRTDLISYVRSSNRIEYCLPALIDNGVGKFYEVTIDAFGNANFKLVYAPYSYE